MRGNINQSMKREHQRANECCQPESLIGADLERPDLSNQKYRTDQDER